LPYEFDRDTRLRPAGEGVWSAGASPRWNTGPTPNGGYLLAIAVTALAEALPHPDPLVVTGHFLTPTASGEVQISVEPLRIGRSQSTALTRMSQRGELRLLVSGTFTALDSHRGLTAVTGSRPDFPPPEACEGPPPDSPHMTECARRFDVRLAPGSIGALKSKPSGIAEMGGWVRFADGRPPDLRSLALMTDSLPPSVFNLGVAGWVPTLELTVHFRAKPAPGWLLVWFRTRFLINAYLEEDGEIWDSNGNLVAQSRQLARLR
jgi:acyl-CoA thioesterase